MYGASEKGWINTELFDSWFDDLFLPSAVAARPLLLLLNGHSTHYQLDVIKKARKIMCLFYVYHHIRPMPHNLLTVVCFRH